MSLRGTRLGLIGIVLIACGPVLAFAQGFDPKARAKEVLDQARKALGGEAALNAIRSLSASGDFRSGSSGAETSGDVQLDLLLPDKLMKTMKWSPNQTTKVTSIETVNGDQVWTDTQTKQPSQISGGRSMGGGGMGRGGGRRSAGGGGGSGGGRQPGGPAPELEEGSDSQQMQRDFLCLIMAMLLHTPDSKAEINYAGDDNIDGAKADLLKIVIGDGHAINFAIDQKTHRPIMAAYRTPMTDISGAGRSQNPEKSGNDKVASSEPEAAEVQIYFSEYRAIPEKKFSNIWMPYQITKTRNGQTVEDMHIKKFQLNPNLKPKQFERKG